MSEENKMKNCVDVYTMGRVAQQKIYCGKIKQLEAKLKEAEKTVTSHESLISTLLRESEKGIDYATLQAKLQKAIECLKWYGEGGIYPEFIKRRACECLKEIGE